MGEGALLSLFQLKGKPWLFIFTIWMARFLFEERLGIRDKKRPILLREPVFGLSEVNYILSDDSNEEARIKPYPPSEPST